MMIMLEKHNLHMEEDSFDLFSVIIVLFLIIVLIPLTLLGLPILVLIPLTLYYVYNGIPPFKSKPLHLITIFFSILVSLPSVVDPFVNVDTVSVNPGSIILFLLAQMAFFLLLYTISVAFLCGLISFLQQYFGPRDPPPLETVFTRIIRWSVGLPGDVLSDVLDMVRKK